MKRLNPLTNLPFQCGDVREDGFIFRKYALKSKRKTGYFAEIWLSPTAFKKDADGSNTTSSLWAKINPHRANAKNAKRRAKRILRTPPWLSLEHIKQISNYYKLAKQLQKQTGITHHVDHIIPLQGETVSGLHVPWNLQILTASENRSKSNKVIFAD